MKILAVLLIVVLYETAEAARSGKRCKAAVHAIPKPSNGKVLACCRYKRIKFVCNAGYKLSGGDAELRCRKGRVYGKFSKCIRAHKQACGRSGYNLLQGRIVGGDNSLPGSWPWMVAIYRDDQFVCGGALITSSHVLTAAHCFYSWNTKVDTPSSYQVWLGRTNLGKNENRMKQFSKVEKIYVHEYFSLRSFSNDIAIMKLETSMKFTRFVQPLCLPRRDESKTKEAGFVIGWGSTIKINARQRPGRRSNVLKHVMQPIASDATCEKSTSKYSHYYKQTMFCAGNGRGQNDACQGDSGGPFVVYEKLRSANNATFYKWSIAGIVSWGEGCAQKNKYGFYTRVFTYRKWIQNIIG